MNANQYTEKAQEAIQESQKLAIRYSHQTIEPEHLLLALMDQEGRHSP
jgi:ATP-dependent Clp protease ATP-binding subunit ClpB